MPPRADTLVEDEGWHDIGLPDLAGCAIAAVVDNLGLPDAPWEISVLGCGDARIAGLNAAFRGKPVPTNVLSWPSQDRAPKIPGAPPPPPDPGGSFGAELGDIAIAIGTCRREAEAADIPVTAHVTHLLVHAILHLLGYDHERDDDAALMAARETAILAQLGLPDPYRDGGGSEPFGTGTER